MTLDQIYFLLTDPTNLSKEVGERTQTIGAHNALAYADDKGAIKGRDVDGNEIKAVIKGESLCSRLNKGT